MSDFIISPPQQFWPMRMMPATIVLSPSVGQFTNVSNVKVKRPDGTWADVLPIAGVRLKLSDGTWAVFT